MDTCTQSIVPVQIHPSPVRRTRGRTWRPALRPPHGIRLAGGRKRPRRELPATPGGSGPPRPAARPSEAERETLLVLMGYWPKLLELAQAAGIAEADAPDVAQLVILRAVRAFRAEDGPPRVAWLSWLETATRYVAHVYRRAHATRLLDVRAPEDFHDVPDEREDDLAGLTLDDLRGMTQPEYWRVFVAYAVEGRAVKDIAAAERIPAGTVYNRLRLARRDLAAALTRQRLRNGRHSLPKGRRVLKERAKG